MPKISITLTENERDALVQLAIQEYREPRLQAALLIRDQLIRVGLLNTTLIQNIANKTLINAENQEEKMQNERRFSYAKA